MAGAETIQNEPMLFGKNLNALATKIITTVPGCALATLCIGDGFGEQARSMEVEVSVEMIAAERINEGREALRDVAVAKLFAYD